MNRKQPLFLLFSFLLGIPGGVFAAGGTSGGNILSIPVGARPIAMGEAYTALADDISSLYWNPAGIAILNQSQASFMYNPTLVDSVYQHAAIAAPWEFGGIGGSLSYLSYGNIRGFNASGDPTGDVSAYSMVGTGSGGFFMGPWAFGASIKGVQSKLDTENAMGVAGDLGMIWTHQKPVLGEGTLRLGATIRNLGTGMKFIDQRDPFPRQWRLGAALLRIADKRLQVSADIAKERDTEWAGYAGAEYKVHRHVSLRAGYAATEVEGNGVRAGIGIHIRDFSFDYAYSNYGDLGMSNRYELSMRFGPIRSLMTPEERAMYRRAIVAMENDRYDEATLILDSLSMMHPTYRPLRRDLKVALRGVETQERIQAGFDTARVLSGAGPHADDAIDEAELTALLDLSEDLPVVARNDSMDATFATQAPTLVGDMPDDIVIP